MRIYLADLFHVYQSGRNPDTSPYTVPLGIGFLASTIKGRMPECEIRLFRDPNRLLKSVRSAPADIVGFSFCSWNSDLSARVAAVVKKECPDVITVGGGPSVDDADDQIVDFFGMFPSLDFLVPNEGESGFLALVEAVKQARHSNGSAIPGVAYLDDAGKLIRGAYQRPIVPGPIAGMERTSPKQLRPVLSQGVEIPSPYLDGTLDEFLDEGLIPIIQTMRGCPYQCEFCVSGATDWNRLRGFDIERVEAEIDYALSRSRAKDLILTDENWGILGERDVELARFIMDLNRRKNAPTRLYYYTAKIVTPASKEIVELVAPIAWIGEFTMSFQSLNPETRKAIKRTNIGMDKLAANIEWARERNIKTSSEMIYGFPYETPDTFFDGVERLIREGVTSVTTYPLQLFPGIDLAGRKARQNYELKTRFRPMDCGYGVYDEGRLVSVETEEVVISTKWSSEDSYFKVRRYGFFQMAILGRGYFTELFSLCSEAGVSLEPVIRKLALADYSHYPNLGQLMAEHRREAESELKSSCEEVYAEFAEDLRRGRDRTGVKVNLVLLGKLMSSVDAINELIDIIEDYVSENLADGGARQAVLTYIDDILRNRIVVLSQNVAERVTFTTRFDYRAWGNGTYGKVADLLLTEARPFEAFVPEVLQQNLASFDPANRNDLQGIFDRTPSKFLLRHIQAGTRQGLDDSRVLAA